MTLIIMTLSCYAECCAESGITLSVILNVIKLSVIMLSVVAP